MNTDLTILRIDPDRMGEAHGITVVIDVIRAFTVAAYAFAGGAERLLLVRTPEQAFALRERVPGALLAGEIGGRLIPGFDLNNSPSAIQSAEVRGKTIIQRTGAGTQGAVGAVGASLLLVASLVNARATAVYAGRLARQGGEPITLFPSGHGLEAIEDSLCADYLEALLLRPERAHETLDGALDSIRDAGRLDSYTAADSDFPEADIPAFMAVDRFSFAMRGKRRHYAEFDFIEVVSVIVE
jgi:2-phosphosulfolactate phosphatase